MDEEHIVISFGRTGQIMADFMLKALFLSVDKIMELKGMRTFLGETEWQKFISGADKVDVQDLLTTEVNLDKLKTELERYGIGFAFYKQSESKTLMAYALKHKAIVEKVFSEVIKDIIKEPKKFADSVKKHPHEKTVTEKLKEYKEKTAKEVEQKQGLQQTEEKISIHEFLDKTNKAKGLSK
ncbi:MULTISPECIES: hypothetical protein [unclassified Granulicatella]|uniref:hypothetical protein n=1 Tax=unclassified Granulicatella TaxID=2630493 RepID=UPI00107307C3|nr:MULTISPECIES: hypothetical protein [unclassified Granulicatella]MBF0780593.1 hypothetical protein [Granulicatella sp. 19428wC4_WM01]TFU94621.1 hypothetical protein E4T68_05720 [Granulicatella sp. WM01]